LKNPDYRPLEDLERYLKPADLAFVNLESVLSDQGGVTQSPTNRLIFSAPPGGARTLALAGIDMVSIANNHIWDYHREGFNETLQYLEEGGILYAGASRKPEWQYRPTVFEAKGWSVAMFAVTHIWNQGPFEPSHPGYAHVAWAAFPKLQAQLAIARKKYDVVLVSYHGSGEYIDFPMQWSRTFIRQVMRVGVDALIGHHPHVVHGVAWHGQRPALYSLGNLVFNMHKDYPATGTGYLARLTFSRNSPVKVEACPYHIMGHRPLRYTGKGKEALEQGFVRRLKQVSVTTGGTAVGDVQDDGCFPLSRPEDK
jgi:poly-gamma-glutamate synthesis protein (capsule biosynthesis protein)